jgi:hypothetical protein
MRGSVRSRAHPPYPPHVRERTGGLGKSARADTAERWHLELRDTGGAQPADVRLRIALKLLLRAFGLRCEAITRNHAHAGAPEQHGGTDTANPRRKNRISVRDRGGNGHRGNATQGIGQEQ